MKNKAFLQPFCLVVALCVLSVSIFSSGCTPLRKKFTRKKTKEQLMAHETVPILEPIEYPDKTYSAQELYRYRYSLFQVWSKDLLTAIEDEGGKKKILYNLDQVIVQIDMMSKYLKSGKKEGLGEVKDRVIAIKEEFKEPVSTFSPGTLRLKVESICKVIRQQFSPRKVESDMDTIQYETVD